MGSGNFQGPFIEVHFTENEYQRTYEIVKKLRKKGHPKLTVSKFVEKLTKREVDKLLIEFHKESLQEVNVN